MKLDVFVEKNKKQWTLYEKILTGKEKAFHDDIIDLYLKLTDDLSYAKTYYPDSDLVSYLNYLTSLAHQNIYRNKKISGKSIIRFWKYEFPLIFYQNKRYFFYSAGILLISAIIGWLSAASDQEFVRMILGDAYVNMTEENIKNGDPMAVYKSASQSIMFLGITINNITVAFYALIMGIFTAFGTAYILFQNGIMLGAFHYLMYSNGVLEHAVKVIWLHGTIEIFSIIVAGMAGMMIGNSFIFPGTYKRGKMLRIKAYEATKIALGLVPFFTVAGFIEGYITRHTEMPDNLKMTIIIGSALFLLFYFFIYPGFIIKTNKNVVQNT